MNHRTFFAALLAGTALASPALAADLAVKAPVAAPILISDWSGVYVGLEAGYGWGKQSIDSFAGRLGIAGVDASGTVNFPAFAGPGVGSVTERGWLAGGFFGVQKQLGSWVLGLEGDIDATGIKGSASATSVHVETLTGPGPVFVTTQPVDVTS